MDLKPEAVMRNWFEDLWNRGREDTIDRLLAREAIAHGLPGGPLRGPDNFRPVFHMFRGAFPDLRISVERTVTEGDYVAAFCRVTGTHSGNTLGVAPTGRKVDFNGVTIARVADGQIHEGWNCFDFLTMYLQLGVIPEIPGPQRA